MLNAQSNILQFAGGWTSIMPQLPVQLAGFGRGRRSSRTISEPLEANVVLLQCCDGKIVFVQLDVVSVGEHLRREILRHFAGRLQDHELFLVASHTHSAPNIDLRLTSLGPVDDQYLAKVLEAVIRLLDRVLAAPREPILFHYGEGLASHSINRRCWCLEPVLGFPPVRRVMALHPNPQGPRDDTVRAFLGTRATDGATPLGVLWNYACHPVTAWPPCAISADYPGAIRLALRSQFSPELPVVFLPGFCGNLRPNRIDNYPLSPYYMLHRIVNGPVFGRFGEKSNRTWTASLSEVVLRILSSRLRPVELSRIRSRRLTLPMQDLMKGTVDSRELSLDLVDLEPSFAIFGVSAEPVVEYIAALRTLFRRRTLIPVGYIDAVCAYLPTSNMLPEGGLEVDSPGYGLEGTVYRENVSQLVFKAVQNLAEDTFR